jgi:hypothetical protein
VGKRCSGHPHHSDHIHIEHAVPLCVLVRGDVADRTDARVVHDEVESPNSLDRVRYCRPYGLIVSDVTTDPEERSGDAVRIQVKARDLRAAGGKQPRRG